MIEIIDVRDAHTLDDYAEHIQLKPALQTLQAEAKALVHAFEGRTVWMVNSTAEGGGVAEMMPKLVTLLRELGVDTEWVVINPSEPRFFNLTKQLHNLLHDAGSPDLDGDDRALFEAVSREVAEPLQRRVSPDDLVVVHDPQPLGMGALLKQELGVPTVWRCHIGLDRETPRTQAAWEFLKPWAEHYDRSVFSVWDYVPPFLQGNAAVIPPAIDPLSHKNRELPVHKLAGILRNASLAEGEQPVLTPPFASPAMRLQPDGSFAPATEPEDLGLLFRPTVVQVSRWDRLKGFAPLLKGFAHLKRERHARQNGTSNRHARRLELVRLMLVGPDPASVQDDPEGQEVFEEISRLWHELPPHVQQDVAVLMLPMDSRKNNALMVNVLQRCATVVVQNSLQEGFGLTATEGMWKGRPVMGSRAVGLRTQIRDGVEGRLIHDAEDPEEIADTLNEMLKDEQARETWSRNAQRRVANEYLVFSQARRWLEVLNACCTKRVAS